MNQAEQYGAVILGHESLEDVLSVEDLLKLDRDFKRIMTRAFSAAEVKELTEQ